MPKSKNNRTGRPGVRVQLPLPRKQKKSCNCPKQAPTAWDCAKLAAKAGYRGYKWIMGDDTSMGEGSFDPGTVLTHTTPAARSFKVRGGPPSISSRNGVTTIEGHEFVQTIAGSAAFSATKIDINPGLSNTFPWLAGRANGFEKYRFRALQFLYIPAEAVTTTAGSVYMAADYDPEDAVPTSLASLSTYETQDSDRVYNALGLNLSVERMFDGVQVKRMRQGPVSGDLGLYDPASLIIATISCASSADIGQLWIRYVIDLISPSTEPGTLVPRTLTMYNLSTNQTLVTNVGAAIDFDESLCDGIGLGAPSSGVWTMPVGTYRITVSTTMSTTATESTTIKLSAYKNGAALSPEQSSQDDNASFAANAQMSITSIFYITSNGTDTFEAFVTLIGATGTLTLKADKTRVSIEVV